VHDNALIADALLVIQISLDFESKRTHCRSCGLTV
jgi:hypothetical protein